MQSGGSDQRLCSSSNSSAGEQPTKAGLCDKWLWGVQELPRRVSKCCVPNAVGVSGSFVAAHQPCQVCRGVPRRRRSRTTTNPKSNAI